MTKLIFLLENELITDLVETWGSSMYKVTPLVLFQFQCYGEEMILVFLRKKTGFINCTVDRFESKRRKEFWHYYLQNTKAEFTCILNRSIIMA